MELVLIILVLVATAEFLTIINLDKENKELESLAKARARALKEAETIIESKNFKIENRDLLLKSIKGYEIKELQKRVVDLKNNVEFLYNNLTPKKRELVRPSNQN